MLINEAQQQAEALKVFRDTHTWYEFENGGVYNGVSYGGVSVRYASPVYDCESGLPGVQPCFRMVRKPFGAEYQWVPVQGPSSFDDTSSQIPGTYYVISGYPYTSGGCINAVICRDSYDFYLSYGATAAGQSYGDFGAGTERASMAIKLQNLETLQP